MHTESISDSHNTNNTTAIIGASSIENGKEAIHQQSKKFEHSQNVQDASSCILYLHSRDPRVREFSCSAADAMQMIGIKRSRLTQISGKSLACARIKIGRYIRPMYRPQDIEDYVRRSRISQSQHKSRHIIETSTTKLIQEAEKISSCLEHATSEWHQSMQNRFLEILATLKEEFSNSHEIYHDIYKNIQQRWLQSVTKLEEKLHDLEQKTENILKNQHEFYKQQLVETLRYIETLQSEIYTKQIACTSQYMLFQSNSLTKIETLFTQKMEHMIEHMQTQQDFIEQLSQEINDHITSVFCKYSSRHPISSPCLRQFTVTYQKHTLTATKTYRRNIMPVSQAPATHISRLTHSTKTKDRLNNRYPPYL